jgi:aminopeptidase N
MRDAQPAAIYLRDYRPPAYLIEQTELYFQLHDDCAIVSSRLHMRRNDGVPAGTSLQLHGEELELLELGLDGKILDEEHYALTGQGLEIAAVPDRFLLECRTRIRPQDNTSLDGLYRSRSMFCTQCEAHGFRKITYYLDRPDVMSVFTVTVEADREQFPVLLSNGNPVATAALPGGRHSATWHDPFAKPAYLFALVAGKLEFVEDSFRTCTGRDICLRIYVEDKDLGKCDHAMRSLKKAMCWDEEVYGREYDLDIFNIVAVDDFNMGAMENKSLNIFNSSCVLCSPETTTDRGFQNVEAIVAHEYFHNWSGNRVTCRDWFQLSLKEGFTVFRDSQFSADMGSPTVHRIEQVNVLRTAQFAEDAGPMAHPVRPESVIEINNFYTLTVYEKGAEVVRMMHTLLGPAAFRQGSDLYFERHDGQAVTCEDFVRAMEDASGVDLRQFRNWYSQAGTPLLTVRDDYDAANQRYTLHVEQSCPPTPGQPDKQPLVIPLAMSLLGAAGRMPLRLAGAPGDAAVHAARAGVYDCVLRIDQPRQSFIFEGVGERPVPSLLRGFSAPVRLDYPFSKSDLRALMSRDDDGLVRWDSAQALATRVIHEVEQQLGQGADPAVDPLLTEACCQLLAQRDQDPAMVAEMLQLPGENYLAELAGHDGGADVDGIHHARNAVQAAIARACCSELLDRYHQLADASPYSPDAAQVAARSLRNTCLEFLASADRQHLQLAWRQFSEARNMTDRLAALRVLACYGDEPQRERALDTFYRDWHHDALVINQWFQVQAAIPVGDTLQRVRGLLAHADFDLHNPNKVRALVGAFANNNPIHFHRIDGQGYRLLADVVIELNRLNPQIAARLLTPLSKWRVYRGRAELMRGELARLAGVAGLSPDVYEVVTKSLETG